MRTKRLLLTCAVLAAAALAVGCDDPNKNYQKGEYQKAYDGFMKIAQAKESNLAREYDTAYLNSAKQDAAALVEAYYKAGECKEKLGDSAAAKALFEKATKVQYTVTERYAVQQEVWVDAGYQQVWVPGGYTEVWIDGKYEEVWVDPYYDASGVYHDGYYKKVWRDGHYEQKYVDGHYETRWVAGHYEQKTVYKTKPYSFVITSAYADQARAKLGAGATPETTTRNPPTPPTSPTGGTASDPAAVKAAKDRLDTAYNRWVAAGMLQSGAEYNAYVEARKAYDALVK